MFPFSSSVTPAVRTHLDSQAAFFNDLSKSMTGAFQNICQANMQLGQAMFEESVIASQRLLTTRNSSDAFSEVASRAQPAADKLRSYQQHLSRLTADTQVDLARVTQEHVQETARTAHALADEVTRTAVEETDRSMRKQEEALKNFRNPFESDAPRGNGSAQPKAAPQPQREGAGASMQVDSQAGNASFHGSAQSQSGQSAQQAANKNPGKPN